MELRDYIEEAAKKAGSLTELGLMLGISQPHMSSTRAQKRPLPVKAVVQLAEYIGADLKAVIAANELVTEKDEKKRAFWHPFVTTAKAASIALAFSLVTNFVTPSPAEAAQTQAIAPETLCIMLSRRFKRHLKKTQLFGAMKEFIKGQFEALQALFPRGITQMQAI